MLSSVDKKNSIWLSSSFIIGSILNFIIYSLCFKSLDREVFGIFIFLTSVFVIGSSLDFGFGVSSIKHVSEAKSKGDYEFISSYFSTYFYVYFFFAIIISAIFYLYFHIFLKSAELLTTSSGVNLELIFLFITLTFLINYQTVFLKCMMEGLNDYVNLSKINIVVIILNFLLILILFFLNPDIYFLSIINLIVSIFSFSISFLYLILNYKILSININRFDIIYFKKFFKYGMKIHFSNFIGSFADPIIKYLIGSFLSLSFITYFESSKKIINFTNGLIFSAQRAVFVKLSEANAVGLLKSFINDKIFYYSKMANYYTIILYGILNPLLCLFILLWFNSFESMIIFLLFLISYSIINFSGCLYSILMVEGKGIGLILIQSINIISIYLFLYISLSMFNNYIGLIGFIISTIVNEFLIFYFLKKDYDFDYKSYFRKIKFNDILKLNILLIIQIIFLYYLSSYKYYILVFSFLLYLIVFWFYFKYSVKKSISIIKSRLNLS